MQGIINSFAYSFIYAYEYGGQIAFPWLSDNATNDIGITYLISNDAKMIILLELKLRSSQK